jgi:hypothetical protein
MKSTIITFILLTLTVFITSCKEDNNKKTPTEKQATTEDKKPVTTLEVAKPMIADIVSNPQYYEGKIMKFDAKYAGFKCSEKNCEKSKIAMVSKSDVLIYDDSGCIYVKAGVDILSEGKILSPTDKDSYGAKITIEAKVVLINGKPIFDK